MCSGSSGVFVPNGMSIAAAVECCFDIVVVARLDLSSCIDHSINHMKGQYFFLDREGEQRPVSPLNTPLARPFAASSPSFGKRVSDPASRHDFKCARMADTYVEFNGGDFLTRVRFKCEGIGGFFMGERKDNG